MKKTVVTLSLTALALASLAGCTVSGPSVRLHPPISIEGGGGGPVHCPPGQAKKGNC